MADSTFQYLSRTREQILADVYDLLLVLCPEIQDYENDVFVKGLAIYAGIAENLHFYIDNSARENNIESCQYFRSAVILARAEDCRIRSRKPFEAVLTFTLSAAAPSVINIPQGTVVETDEGLIYTTIANATIATGATQTTITAYQQEVFTAQNIGTTTGQASQIVEMSEKLVDGSVVLTIGAQVYTPVETFYYALPDTTVFVQTVGVLGTNQIILGDGVNGKIPSTGQNIIADYALTEGENGKALAGTLTNIVSSITLPIGFTLEVTNLNDASGGKDRDNITEIKRRVKAFNHTTDTAVSREDYIYLAELVAGVARAGINYTFGNTVDAFIIPDGGGLASPALVAAVENYFETRRIILTRVRVSSAGEVRVLLEFDVNLAPNGIRILVEQGIKEALTTFGSVDNQQITGKMVSGTLNQLVCNVDGVQTCVLKVFSIVPYARPSDTTAVELNWNVEMQSGSLSVATWSIVFTSTSAFQVFKNNSFVGNFNVNDTITQPEVEFTVLQNYVAGARWDFNTYPYLGNQSGFYQLTEPSILRIYEDDITLNLIGGI